MEILAMESWKRIYDGPRGSRFFHQGTGDALQENYIKGIDVSETS